MTMHAMQFELMPDGRRARLTAQYVTEVDGICFVIPKNFVTDFASIPRLFWRVLPPLGRYAPAAVLHDYLYLTQRYSRRDSDRFFELAMRDLGVSWTKRKTMWLAVRLFGWVAYYDVGF